MREPDKRLSLMPDEDALRIARQLLRYEPETGKLFWLTRPKEFFANYNSFKSWNAKWAGKEALISYDRDGYRVGGIFGHSHQSHRVAWLLQTGSWPVGEIDHINGIKNDNRWSNLRDVSVSVNQRNTRKQSNNTSGITGVRWHDRYRSWYAHIGVDGKSLHLGSFSTVEEAVAARLAANVKYGFTERHGI